MNEYGIIEKLIKLKEQKNWSYYRIAKESNLPESTVTHIYKKKSLPQIDTLISLCKGFGITITQFFCEDEKYNHLSAEEKEILKLWNSLNTNNKKLLKELIQKLDNN